ncbi:hypothetical protein [Lysinibacillus sp. BW-2-10]|uniref:hypothetical protein n=1 Tax=Lysinibacillus sp. BW-2-10 TaxID=2590030 RepID=UPI00117CE247|nr:hypothetical protein [Lysinibacillus sp. BW-2-10]TSI05179.1 hypothetical protein FJQ64_12785 [Lysinibacillus sp. BW-2-10]
MFWKKAYKEARYAAGMNFDLEDVESFLTHLNQTVLDSGFRQEGIELIMNEIHRLKIDHEQKEVGTFDVQFKGKPTKIRIVAEIHIEDEEKEVVLNMYSIQKLVNLIDKEMMKIGEKLE